MKNIFSLFKRKDPGVTCNWCREAIPLGKLRVKQWGERKFCSMRCYKQFRVWARVMTESWPQHLLSWKI